jgi:hypothetical protein
MKRAVVLVIAVLTLSPAAAQGDEPLVRFDGGIGSQPFARVNNAVAPNDVQGVLPGGRPWVIANLNVDVRTDGEIRAVGRGLLLGGGNGVGTTGGQSVHARLFCGGVPHNSAGVLLEPNGDFRIEGVLSPVPPAECASPVLLIVSGTVAGAGNWFAAGIPVLN